MSEDSNRLSMDKLGKLLVEEFKDKQLQWFDKLCKGECKGDVLGLQKKVQALDNATQEVISACIIECVTSGIHDFLFQLEVSNDFEKDIQLFVDNKNVVDLSDGIYAELLNSDGWDARFSRYPTSDQLCIKYNKEAGLPYFTEEDNDEFIDQLVKGEIQDYDDVDRLLEEQQKRSVESQNDEKKDA